MKPLYLRQHPALKIPFLILLLVGNALFLRYNAFRCLNFFDMGGFIDASWRVYSGQRPYIDFIYTTGPVHLYMNALFFHLFSGFGKWPFWAHLVVIQSIVSLVPFTIMSRKIPFAITMLVTVLATTCFYWPVSHPWYDQSAHLWGICAVGLLVSRVPFQNARRAFITAAFCGVMAVVSFMTKTNVGAAYGFIFFLVLMLSEKRKHALAGYGAGILIAGLLMLLLIRSPGKYIEQVFMLYGRQETNRLAEVFKPANWFVNYYWIVLFIVTAMVWPYMKKFRELFCLFVGIYVVAIVTILTGSMIKPANIMLLGIFMALGFILIYHIKENYREGRRQWLHRGSVCLLSIITIGLIILSVHYGRILKVWTYIRPDIAGNYQIEADPIKGWWCQKDKGELLDQMHAFIQSHVPRKDSLLVLGDMQILYALTARESYRGVPFMFQTDELPVKGRQQQEVKKNILANPPRWVLLNLHGPTFGINLLNYLGIKQVVQTQYLPVMKWKYYVLLRHK